MNNKLLGIILVVSMISLASAFGIDNPKIPRLSPATTCIQNVTGAVGGNATGNINMRSYHLTFFDVGDEKVIREFGENTLLFTGDKAPNINFGFGGRVYSANGNTDLGEASIRWKTNYVNNIDILNNITVGGLQGISGTYTIMKTAVTTCDLIFTGGILTSTDC